jgi:probable A/G-specific adenine glycosylase
VPRELLTDFSTDITVPDALKVPVQDLRKLDSSQEQIDRCYSGLLKDKLAKERKDRVSL